MIIFYFLALIFIFYLLAKVCDEYFVKSLDIITKKLKLSEDVAGATFMAMGTSAPELFTAILALTKVGSEDIGAGTIVGSAIFNILVIVGASAAVAAASLRWQPVIRDLGFYIISILVLLFTFQDGKITSWEAATYLLFYGIYILIFIFWRKIVPERDQITSKELAEIEEEIAKDEKLVESKKGIIGGFVTFIDKVMSFVFPDIDKKPGTYPIVFALSILLIAGLSWALVEIAILFAAGIGMPPVIVALTILAGGTSVPDLLASLIVAKKGRGDMAVSNAVGSNTFDILIGLGLPWFGYILITQKSVTVATENLTSSILLLFFTVIALFLLLAMQKFKLKKTSGYTLLVLYGGYLLYNIFQAYHII